MEETVCVGIVLCMAAKFQLYLYAAFVSFSGAVLLKGG